MPEVVLITMPWAALGRPSIQLGILESVLAAEGIESTSLFLNLRFAAHWAKAPIGGAVSHESLLAEYSRLLNDLHAFGAGDWIFGVPPFRTPTPEMDEAYFALLRANRADAATISMMMALRELVPAFLDDCAGAVLDLSPRIVAFTTSSSQNVASLVLSQILKDRDPSLRVVFGGANCDGPMGAALHRSFPWVDVVVRGEGEQVFPMVVRSILEDGEAGPAPGLCYRRGEESIVVPQTTAGRVPMDEIPIPDYDDYFRSLDETPFATKLSPHVKILFESARGCWWGERQHCTFCGLNGSSMAFRSKSPERVFRELGSLSRRYKRLRFQCVDNILDLAHIRELMPTLARAGAHFDLFYETKSNLKKHQIELLYAAGLRSMQPGIESLSTPTLRLMKKGVSAFYNIRTLKWCAELGIEVYWNLIYGFPGEEPAEYAMMADLARSLVHLAPPSLTKLMLERFSPYHQRPEDFGVDVVGPAPHYSLVYDLDPAALLDLAYSFEYRHADGRDPESYIDALRPVVEEWNRPDNRGSLTYACGPGFMIINDRRSTVEAARYVLEDHEKAIYVACDPGATVAEICKSFRGTEHERISPDEVKDFLGDLAGARLLYEENGRYLALAISGRPAAPNVSEEYLGSVRDAGILPSRTLHEE